VPSSQLSIPDAPARAHRFRSDDLDEVLTFVGRSVGEHSRVPHRKGAVGFELAVLGGDSVQLGWGQIAIPMTIRGTVPEPVLHLAMPPGSEYLIGRRRFVGERAAAMFLAPGWEFSRCSPAGSSFVLGVSGRRLADEVDARLSAGRSEFEMRLQCFDVDPAERANLLEAVQELVQLGHGGAERSRAAHAEARLVSAVAGLLIRQEAVAKGREVASSRMADLEAWIDSHLQEPLTIGRLCQVAGVGERSLQMSFVSRRGVSPMRFVTERRLAEAHRRLKASGAKPDVTSIAMELGFRHMGRFAMLYREAFGEVPSRSRQRSAHSVSG
jgi:AraC-like DNA-binding protein